MKKFSTAALVFAFAAAFGSLAAPAAQAAASTCAFLPNAPDQHTVVKGDTLWDISGKFLVHPWCWPQVWDMNREEIHNPHWIYPGQIVYFDRVAGRLRLGQPTGGANGGRLSPQVRVAGTGKDAVTSIPSSAIEAFLTQPLIIENDELTGTPHIVAAQEGHVNIGNGEKAYVAGDLKDGTSFQAFRPGTPLKDPVTKKVIGYEAAYLGTLKLQRTGQTPDEAHSFVVVDSKQEMSIGDRLLPVPPTPIMNYVPHPPEQPVDARIVSIYGGVDNAGQNQVVTINRGSNDGIDIGTVLQLSRFGQTVVDKGADQTGWFGGKPAVKLPDEQYGTLFVFRTFKNIAYGLIMQVTDTVNVGDFARSPE